jgi:hypothetical protein
VLAGDGTDDEETQASALNFSQGAVGDTIEALKNSLKFVSWNANAMIANAEDNAALIGRFEGDIDVDAISRIFDGIIEQVEYGGAEFFVIPGDHGRAAVER